MIKIVQFSLDKIVAINRDVVRFSGFSNAIKYIIFDKSKPVYLSWNVSDPRKPLIQVEMKTPNV